jgi:Ca2+-binding EF-hand superfamily protein
MMNRLLLLSLFSALPAAGLAQLTASRAELIARMGQADADHDGTITRAELLAWRKANFVRFDRNGDGALSDADVPTFLRGTSIGAQFDQLKAQFDANRDGRVTREEFVGAPTVLFDAADANRDNLLTRAERDAAVAAARATRG